MKSAFLRSLLYTVYCLTLFGTPFAAYTQTQPLMPLDSNSAAPPRPWEVVQFDTDIPATIYLVREWDGLTAIEAQAHESMALLEWVFEKRNILADAQAQFDTADIAVTSVAVASDTDNTKETVRAGFADIHFVSAGTPCRFPSENDR
ncbi:DUF3047 domain-containing protein [Pusillimonas sp. DMV24BSW_D]|uniref:DUF3047 domain-containing protein n=1 Tax=Neopusillimonas aestuarii TaxID=2716226 RepID=UPI00140867FE|nr:DUF3047 domain-containing protein [Pusillimonas sp. DMV24BSW_D]QIM48161.1 DUF3047 domain-containing protein [Pusillimonas sp. DMV24BSW_D]